MKDIMSVTMFEYKTRKSTKSLENKTNNAKIINKKVNSKV